MWRQTLRHKHVVMVTAMQEALLHYGEGVEKGKCMGQQAFEKVSKSGKVYKEDWMRGWFRVRLAMDSLVFTGDVVLAGSSKHAAEVGQIEQATGAI